MTVTGTTLPLSSKICVIPTLRPSNPIAIAILSCGRLPGGNTKPRASLYLLELPVHRIVRMSVLSCRDDVAANRSRPSSPQAVRRQTKLMPARGLDLVIHARRQTQLVQCLDR